MSVSKTYQIRYNTVSQNDTERWRLIENGNETLVANIIIDGSTYTTKDWMEEIQDYKWHITCEGHCEVKNNIAYIKTVKEKSVLKRHIFKSISWRIIGTIDTMILGWVVTGNPLTGLKIGTLEVLTKMTLYFLHERIWYKYVKIKK
jgi:uncharacterized membrane protein